MSAILTAIVYVKSVGGIGTLNGVATARLDDEECIDFQYKAFNVNEGGLLETIQANTIIKPCPRCRSDDSSFVANKGHHNR